MQTVKLGRRPTFRSITDLLGLTPKSGGFVCIPVIAHVGDLVREEELKDSDSTITDTGDIHIDILLEYSGDPFAIGSSIPLCLYGDFEIKVDEEIRGRKFYEQLSLSKSYDGGAVYQSFYKLSIATLERRMDQTYQETESITVDFTKGLENSRDVSDDVSRWLKETVWYLVRDEPVFFEFDYQNPFSTIPSCSRKFPSIFRTRVVI